jgi:CheY-like chemotaxis protein
MSAAMPLVIPGKRYKVLVVDDEPDIHSVTKLSLKTLTHAGKKLKFINASTGEEALQIMRAQPDVAVILLDVVMESDSAGLDACREIREGLGNHLVRILLRTGQPGSAPERETIDTYDIDGYLPKAELSSTRLYAAVRTAVRAWDELASLERHRRYLDAIHEGVVSLRSFQPLEQSLEQIVSTAVLIQPTPLAVLCLETFSEQGDPRRTLLHLSDGSQAAPSAALAADVARRVGSDAGAQSRTEPGPLGDDYLVPLILHRDLGYGWVLLQGVTPDLLAAKALQLLASHAANSLYSAVAQTMLEAREGPAFDSMAI